MRPWRVLTAAALVAALAFTAGGCSVLGGGGSYRMVVHFAKTPALYEKSRVKVMGANAGDVADVRIEGRHVRVELHVDSRVPVPADARATIAAESAIGERGVVLYPAWKPGMKRAAPGAVIPVERTDPPVEIDEVLGSFTTLAESLDPAKVRGLLDTGAQLLGGRGQSVNEALATTTDLADGLAAQDRQIVSAATGLRDLAATLNRHDDGLRTFIDAFNATSSQLADERTRLKNLLVGLTALIDKGRIIITAYRETLPSTLAEASSLVMTLKANSASMAQAMTGLSRFTDLIVKSWDPKTKTYVVRAQLNATLRVWLQPLFTRMGWGKVPCVDSSLGKCPRTIERKGPR
ncbi:MCE family protein [Spirillospora sp. NPDC047279]|uniref:MCE family protein n=1 Tax=Spirillospora sp. NPDC047279 TaxID=3155478 RepID=UPI0033C153AC